MTLPDHVSSFTDRHGKTRYRWRRRGLSRYIAAEPNSPEFHEAVEQLNSGIGVARPKGRPERPDLPQGQVVYFIAGAGNAVKIGTTGDLRQRLAELRCASAVDLTLLAFTSGSVRMERILHVRFAKHRIRGEWFARHPELDELIDELSNASNCEQRLVSRGR